MILKITKWVFHFMGNHKILQVGKVVSFQSLICIKSPTLNISIPDDALIIADIFFFLCSPPLFYMLFQMHMIKNAFIKFYNYVEEQTIQPKLRYVCLELLLSC